MPGNPGDTSMGQTWIAAHVIESENERIETGVLLGIFYMSERTTMTREARLGQQLRERVIYCIILKSR